jgi:DNA-binding MarR family transcriptional regulator
VLRENTEPSRGQNFIIVREDSQEFSVQHCLESLGISLLSEWDVLAFLCRHGVSLTTCDQIGRLIGYESAVVGHALDQLEREKLIERSRPLQGVRLYRISTSTDAGRRRCLRRLVSLSESRTGRLLLAKQLKPVRPESGEENQQHILLGEQKDYA